MKTKKNAKYNGSGIVLFMIIVCVVFFALGILLFFRQNYLSATAAFVSMIIIAFATVRTQFQSVKALERNVIESAGVNWSLEADDKRKEDDYDLPVGSYKETYDIEEPEFEVIAGKELPSLTKKEAKALKKKKKKAEKVSVLPKTTLDRIIDVFASEVEFDHRTGLADIICYETYFVISVDGMRYTSSYDTVRTFVMSQSFGSLAFTFIDDSDKRHSWVCNDRTVTENIYDIFESRMSKPVVKIA